MTGGIHDYEDSVIQEMTWSHPDKDVTPLEYIYSINKTFICEPGECLVYSGVAYEILGLVLAQNLGYDDWR